MEIVGTIVHQLTRSLTESEVAKSPFANYFVDHTTGVYPVSAAGVPWTAAYIGVKGDVIADLTEDMAAEQKARVTYDNILRLSDDPDVNNVIRFLREREIVHFQRFGEALRLATERMDQKNVYAINPAFDKAASNMMQTNVNPAAAEKTDSSPTTTDYANLFPLSAEKDGVSPAATNKHNAPPMMTESYAMPPMSINKTNLSPLSADKKTGLNPISRADKQPERSWMDK